MNVLLLIDEGTLFGLEKIVNAAVSELLASLSPRDRVGLVTTRPGSASVPLTTNHQAVGPAVGDLDDNGNLVLVAANGRIATDPDDLGVYA